MITSPTDPVNNLAFGKFLKIKGNPENLEEFRSRLKNKSKSEFMTLLSQKTKNKGVLYIFSGKDLDKTLKIIRKNTFLFGFRRNPEKFLEKKAKSLKILEAYKKLKQGKLF